jgi:pimeloyl-ACP methyl ester carboxylesterase
VWRRIAPHLAGHRRVFYFDLLGYGRSEMRPGQDVSLATQNRLFTALLDHWRIQNPDVVAHDFGGCTALRTCLLDGRSYRSLTLIDPVALSPWGSPFVRHVREHEAAFAGLPPYIHEAVVKAYVRGAIARDIPDEELAPYVTPWLGATGQAAFYRQIAQMDQRYTDAVETRYSQMRCPTQILWGEDDQWIPLERGRQLAAVIPEARFQAVPKAGHLLQEDAPEAIVAAALRWFD